MSVGPVLLGSHLGGGRWESCSVRWGVLGDVHKSHFDGVQRMIASLGWVVRRETGRDYGQLSGNVLP